MQTSNRLCSHLIAIALVAALCSDWEHVHSADKERAAATPQTDMRQGKIRQTGRSLDLAIEGEGCFWLEPAEWKRPADSRHAPGMYCTRCGRFSLDEKGRVVLRGAKRNWLLIPSVTIPPGASNIEVNKSGEIWVTEARTTAEQKADDARTMVGTLSLLLFPPDCSYTPDADGVYLAKFSRRQGHGVANPGVIGVGQLRQGCLEDSNVDSLEHLGTLQKRDEQADLPKQTERLLHAVK